jgi:hypothetical protein
MLPAWRHALSSAGFGEDEGTLITAGRLHAERELGLHLFPKLILVVELPNTNNWTN